MADVGSDVAALADPPLMATSGALGDELKHSKKGAKRKKSKKDRKSEPKRRSAGESAVLKPPVYDESPLSEKSNLAGRIDYHLRSPLGVKRRDVKLAKPYHQVNLTTEPFITFVIQANKNEFIRFKHDSLSVVYYGTMTNRIYDAEAAAGTDAAAKRVALRASQNEPSMYMDPSVLGAGFFHRVEVLVDNVPCLSNADLNSLHLQYVRMARIFTNKPPGPYFKTDLDFETGADKQSEAMKAGMAPFDAEEYNSTQGYRMPVFLDGYFPFNLKNRSLESYDKRKEPNLYFPPDTTITVKLHAHRTKFESIFHPELANNFTQYFQYEMDVADLDKYGIRFTLLDAVLEYESVQLHPLHHAEIMKAYRSGGSATYNYDKVTCQHTALMPGLSMTENRFQIPAHARLLYILFLPDYATFNIEATRRPLSGLTRFPVNCTNMSISFAGEEHLIHERLENFGIPGRHVEPSKRIYWNKLREDRMCAAKFEELFPKLKEHFSVIQALVVNMSNYISDKVETLCIRSEFAGVKASPERQQIVVMSVHPTGTLTCKADQGSSRWNWEFGTLSS